MESEGDAVRQMEAKKCYDALKIAASSYMETEMENMRKSKDVTGDGMQVDIQLDQIDGYAAFEALFGPDVSSS